MMNHNTQLKSLPLIVCLMAIASLATADTSSLLGVVDFPTSGSEEAQPHFIEGLLYLHNFEYAEAADAFKRAQELDEDFAMAYWGEAMAYNHPLWAQQARKSGEETLRRLGRTPEKRRAKAGTQREKDFLHAIEILYGTVPETKKLPKEDRDDHYRDAMRRLHQTYPDDHEAATFYGLSILGTCHEGREFAAYMQGAAVLTGVWDENREHPGAAHYLIHSYDDPTHAPLGLPMARAYSKIAPGAAHAQHMVSHIFVALGMWDDMELSNRIAIGVEEASGTERTVVLGHYPHWRQYALIEQGRLDTAKSMMAAGYERIEDNPTGQEPYYYGAMLGRYVIDTEDWTAAEKWATDVSTTARGARDYYFTQAYAAVKRGDLAAARNHLETLRTCNAMQSRPGNKGTLETLEGEILGLIALEEDEEDTAISLLQKAADREATLPFSFGPPPILKPAAELLGEVLLQLGRNDEALAAFETQLVRTPRRTQSLLGLARSAQAIGETATAAENYAQVAAIWHSADQDIAAYDEVTQASTGGP